MIGRAALVIVAAIVAAILAFIIFGGSCTDTDLLGVRIPGSPADAEGEPYARRPDDGDGSGSPADDAPVVPLPVSVEEAGRVADHFAKLRWPGCTIGAAAAAYAPDGLPEVYFFIVCRNAEQATSGEDARFGTVVVGASEEREPFIASLGGLPVVLTLRKQAMEARRRTCGCDPGEPRVVWLPPLFTFFEFPPAEGEARSAAFEVRGASLQPVSLAGWRRPIISDDILRKRKEKWQTFRNPVQ
ncbi:MAG TPA: hypothetical protein VM186_04795 [Planctomycetota bacterium]|nr:hypothetical protein [Planctomycetota bacterium]